MLKKTLIIVCCICVISTLTSFSEPTQKVLKTIIIDPGHGGKDQGAEGLSSTEAQLCLEMSKKLGKYIERNIPGVKVLFTRTTDIIPGNKSDKNEGLRYRADFANNSGADLFMSIHCNSAGKAPGGWYEKKIIDYNYKVTYTGKGKKRKKVTTKIPVYQPYYVVNKVSGTETYIWTAKENSHKEQVVGMGEFSGEKDEGIDVPENDPVIKALKLLYAKKYFKNSLKLAELVQEEFAKSGRPNRGVKQRNEKGIWVLHATGMPSILIETGFISNKEEEEYMMSDKGQSEIVQNIADALKNYITWQEKLQSGGGSQTRNAAPKGDAYSFLKMIDDKETKSRKK